MKAIVVQDGGTLLWQEVAEPELGKEEVLVRVRAAGINRADLAQRAGSYPPPPGASEILGLEVAGEIAEVGEGAHGWRVGERVCALLSGGGYAERVAVPSALLMRVPKGWSLEQAAGFPEVFFTAFLNLFMEADLKEGETVLIHGGASGVGTAAIQLAREAGCRVFATAGTPDKVRACEALGAWCVDYREADFAAYVSEHADGVDVVLDMVGRDYLERNLELLGLGGRLVVIATLSGSRAEVDLRTLMGKRLTLKGSTLRSRPLEEKVRIKERLEARFWSSVEAGTLAPVIDRVFGIEEVAGAHERMRENRNIGKLILQVP